MADVGTARNGHGREIVGLFALSVLACLLLAGRVAWTGTPRLLFLPWNLFLAWVPLAIALATEQLAARIELEDRFIDTLLSRNHNEKPQLHAV